MSSSPVRATGDGRRRRDAEATVSIAAAAEATGTSPDTLRYYESVGVLPPIARTDGGRRAYRSDDLGWITFVRRLRSTGMSIEQLAAYAAMVRAGEGTIEERRRVIEAHRATVVDAIAELADVLELLDRKLADYSSVEHDREVAPDVTLLRHASRLS